jgi:tricorn protease interacting factor F2/3
VPRGATIIRPPCLGAPMTVGTPPLKTEEYRLHLDVDYQRGTWKGTIEFDVDGSAPSVDLDAERLTIEHASVGGQNVVAQVDAERGLLRLPMAVEGRARVHVGFSGAVAEHGLMGLYRSRFGTATILTTQCEPTGARQIFPCIDRPDVKARFRVSVTTDAAPEVVFNTPVDACEIEGSRRRWSFGVTPPMATYLFYLGVGPFERLSAPPNKVSLSILAPAGRSAEGQRALEVARASLEELERYYRIPYPLPKLDLIAVPEFPFGAMENWGAITFRDMQLLIGPATPAGELRYTVATIAHEIAHQWFGNLVTPAWWTDIWLNESFATFVEHKVVERRFPELKSEEDFLTIWTRWGFLLDSLPTTHPVVVEVADTREVNQAIDRLSYGKGASVLRMIEGYLGSSRFEAGVTDYLHRHAWGNARSVDLWEALDRASGQPIARILRPWIERPGHPVVRAKLTERGLELHQQRFSYAPSPSDEIWPIPMVVEIDGKQHRILLETRETVLPAPVNATVHLNPGALGFYRSLYDPRMYARLRSTFDQRSPSDRWSVVEDLWAFLLSGDIDFATFADFGTVLENGSDYPAVSSYASRLDTLIVWAGQVPAVTELARRFLAAQFQRIGLTARPGEESSAGSLRESIVRARVRADPAFARELSEEFPHWSTLDPNVRGAVAAARSATEGAVAFEELRRALAKNPPESEALKLEIALAWNREPTLVERTLEIGLAGEINLGHFYAVILAAIYNPAGRSVAWKWLQSHLGDLQQRLKGTGMLGDLLEGAIPVLGLDFPQEVRAFFAEHPVPEAERGRRNGFALLEAAEKLRARLGVPGSK